MSFFDKVKANATKALNKKRSNNKSNIEKDKKAPGKLQDISNKQVNNQDKNPLGLYAIHNDSDCSSSDSNEEPSTTSRANVKSSIGDGVTPDNIDNQSNQQEAQGEVMSSSSEDEEDSQQEESKVDQNQAKNIQVMSHESKASSSGSDSLGQVNKNDTDRFKQGQQNQYKDGNYKQEESGSSQESGSNSDQTSSSEDSSSESDEFQEMLKVEIQNQLQNSLRPVKIIPKEILAKPNLDGCIKKLPKVGQYVSLNDYEVFFAIRKKQKPITMFSNIGKETKEEMLAKEQENAQIQKQSKQQILKPFKFNLPKIKKKQENNLEDSPHVSTETSQGSNDSSSNVDGQNQNSINLPKSKSMFQRLVVDKIIKKKFQDFSTQTTQKNLLRYIAFDNGRLIILKPLEDKMDGDKQTHMRQFPEFERATFQNYQSQLPLIIWNAKIVRVYKLQDLKQVEWTNQQDILHRQVRRRKIFGRQQISREDKIKIMNQNERDVAILTFKWEDQFLGKQNPESWLPRAKFEKQDYFEKVQRIYKEKGELQKQFGFRDFESIDNAYEMAKGDIIDLSQEINYERRKIGMPNDFSIELPK